MSEAIMETSDPPQPHNQVIYKQKKIWEWILVFKSTHHINRVRILYCPLLPSHISGIAGVAHRVYTPY